MTFDGFLNDFSMAFGDFSMTFNDFSMTFGDFSMIFLSKLHFRRAEIDGF